MRGLIAFGFHLIGDPQAIGTWLRRLGKDNQGIKALRKANKTLLKATLNNCKNITLEGVT
jgi:hypothetical protein